MAPVIGANPVFLDWQGEQQGADPDLGAHGGNPHPNPVQQNQPGFGDAALAANAKGWPAWEPADVNMLEPAMQAPLAEAVQNQIS